MLARETRALIGRPSPGTDADRDELNHRHERRDRTDDEPEYRDACRHVFLAGTSGHAFLRDDFVSSQNASMMSSLTNLFRITAPTVWRATSIPFVAAR